MNNNHRDPTSGVLDERPSEETGPRLDRRRFLASSAATGLAAGAIVLPHAADAQDATPSASPMAGMEGHDHEMAAEGEEIPEGFTAFVPFQSSLLTAACERLIPADENGPGATEAGVVYFIDRQVASNKVFRGWRYTSGPYLAGESTQGDQSIMSIKDRFRVGIDGMEALAQQLHTMSFVTLAPEEQDTILTGMDEGTYDDDGSWTGQGISGTGFFNLLLQFTQAGFLADPVQGGNRGMVGWKLIGFPGAHMSYREEILKYNEPFTGPFISLAQYQQQVTGGGN